ncbi:MAG: GNAT family N-acetyltransferase [Clostridia bacterium]|nr:GNAT family N-acetyltransferase [Clostridia bacterium]
MKSEKRNYIIRSIKPDETAILDEFLYQAIFVPKGENPPPREIINNPELQVYIRDFGKGEADTCLVAELDGNTVGAAWFRIMNDYGHIDDKTPSLAMSVLDGCRGMGIGRNLLLALLDVMREKGYIQVSLSVQKRNYAFHLYESAGFETVGENEEEYLMICRL